MIRPALLLALTLASIASAQESGPTAPAPAAPASDPVEQVIRLPEPGRFKRLFQPFRTDTAALSPDGRYLAYSLRDGENLSVAVVEIDHPEKIKTLVKVVDDTAATPMMSDNQREKTPARINWLRWATPTRVVVETNRIHATNTGTGTESSWQNWSGAVLAFDADGGNARQIAGPDDVYENNPSFEGSGSFAVRREKSAKFNSRVRLPDEALDAAETARAAEDDAFGFGRAGGSLSGEPPAPEAPPVLPVALSSGPSPRNFRIFDLDANRPGAVTLLASGVTRESGQRQLGFYSLDAITGKLTNQADDFVPVNRVPRVDRQGRIRLTIADTVLASFPLAYTYLGPKGQNRPQPLDEITGLKGFHVSPENYFSERAIPLGFDENPNLLYYAANLGRDTYGIYTWDLAAGTRGQLAVENPSFDLVRPPNAGFPDLDILVFDRFTHQLAGVRYDGAFRTTAWLRPEWHGLQGQLEKMFPGRSVEISEWDEAGRRFLFRTEGPADAGAYYLFDREQAKVMEFVRRAPWIDTNQTFVTLPFAFARPDGTRLSGLVTVPQQPRLKPIPMVVLCPDVPWQRVNPDFQTEVQALADMGFAVVQYTGRGAWGFGRNHRQSITAGYDLVQVEDLVSIVTNLPQLFAVNTRRVALLGRGHGGFIALRALQEYPEKFRCAVALDAPVNLADWLAEQRWSEEDVRPLLTKAWLGDAPRLRAAPLTSAPEKITKPILLLSYPGPEGQPRRSGYAATNGFVSSVRRRGGLAELEDLPTDYMRGLPGARAAVFDRIEEFLNVNVYDFQVKMPDIKIIKETKP
jgi:dienelactone hydrolase